MTFDPVLNLTTTLNIVSLINRQPYNIYKLICLVIRAGGFLALERQDKVWLTKSIFGDSPYELLHAPNQLPYIFS